MLKKRRRVRKGISLGKHAKKKPEVTVATVAAWAKEKRPDTIHNL